MRIALLTTDNREHYRDFGSETPSFGTAPEALLAGFSKLPDLEVHVISCLQEPVRSKEKLGQNIWYHALHVPKWGWMRSIYTGCVSAVRRKLREISPDIVHGQGTERDCAIAAVRSGLPNVLTVHGNMRLLAQLNRSRPISYGWLAARLEGWCLARTNGVVCITNYTRGAVEDLARKTWLLPNAVDERYFTAQRRSTSVPLILCVGHISPRKNQNMLIRALDEYQAKDNLRVVFLGHPTPGDPYCTEFAKLVAARPWCEHAGFVDRDGLKQWLEQATILVLPSLEDNCPMVVLESMASGVPVVAANVGGVPDLVKHRVTGLLCDPHDPESIRSAVEQLLIDTEFGSRLAIAAREQAMKHYHPKVVAQQHVEIYREVLGRFHR